MMPEMIYRRRNLTAGSKLFPVPFKLYTYICCSQLNFSNNYLINRKRRFWCNYWSCCEKARICRYWAISSCRRYFLQRQRDRLWHYHSLSGPGQTPRFRVLLYLQVLYIAAWSSAQAVAYQFLEWSKRQGDYIRRIFKLLLTFFYEDLKEFGNKLLKVSLILDLDIRLRWKVWFTNPWQ